MIYFLRNEKDNPIAEPGWIKIGTTIRLSERLKQIAGMLGHTPTVLGVLDGTFAEEHALHVKFDDYCCGGEWFIPHESLLQLIVDESRPWDGSDEIVSATIAVKCYQQYMDWVLELAKRHRMSVPQLIDTCLVDLAKHDGFVPPPSRL